ncbi:MAG: purine nucleoside phosphoramidase [Candidatus Westeberhardia cardiocondylae]|nr:purine nucleoside phosphoramidase [Candidatus Westeberhardia cardiocondylae]
MKIKNTFRKIICHKIPSNIIYQDDLFTAFEDKKPKAPVHIIIVTNIIIPTVNDINRNHEPMLGKFFTIAAKIAIQKKIAKDGYRLVVNCNKHGGQEIYHLHMHLIGGKPLGLFCI